VYNIVNIKQGDYHMAQAQAPASSIEAGKAGKAGQWHGNGFKVKKPVKKSITLLDIFLGKK
jgi:hypothetical protein